MMPVLTCALHSCTVTYMNTTTATNPHGTVTLGKTPYTVETFTHDWTAANGSNHTNTTTILTGPRGGQFHLRPFLGEDKGLREVISYKSGQPLRVRGNEVRVYLLGNIIEVAK